MPGISDREVTSLGRESTMIFSLLKRYLLGEFPGGQVVRIWHFHFHGPGSVPGQGTEIPQATSHGPPPQKKIYCLPP